MFPEPIREALAARPDVDAERVAVAGFCQGGGFALVAAVAPGFSAAAVNYGMDPGKLVMKWKDADRVRAHIVDTTMQRARKGDAFRD